MAVVGTQPDLVTLRENPLNASPLLAQLCQSYLTPTARFFVRNHAPIPEIDEASYRLTVGGRSRDTLELSLADLRSEFPRQTIVATLQCAGNRRRELGDVASIGTQLPWGAEAIGNAEWAGVSLADVLSAAGPAPDAHHVAFTGLDAVEKEGEKFGFGGSIPLDKATAPEVLLAYEMNGDALPPEHGAPLRVLVPGYIGARSVKWLGSISLQDEPSTNFFQARSYKLFPPSVQPGNVDWSTGFMLGELSVNSVICQPSDGQKLPEGPVTVDGYAFAGGGRRVERVDVSGDGGQTWVTADLSGEAQRWAWQLWAASLDLAPGSHQLVVRAWDSAANTQPENARHLWNFKGYVNNAWHRVSVEVDSQPAIH